MSDLVERLRSSEPLPACPYDRLSPHYWTAPNDKPCTVCGGLNDSDAPDLCRGADTRIMGEAADEIDRLRLDLAFCREAMRHADIDLSMVLPLANSDMQKAIRKTLDTIDEARRRSYGDVGSSPDPK